MLIKSQSSFWCSTLILLYVRVYICWWIALPKMMMQIEVYTLTISSLFTLCSPDLFCAIIVLIRRQLLLISRGADLLVWLWWIVKVLSNFWNLSFPLVGNFNHLYRRPDRRFVKYQIENKVANNDAGTREMLMSDKCSIVNLLHLFPEGDQSRVKVRIKEPCELPPKCWSLFSANPSVQSISHILRS